jgi:uncharacterized protein (DUF1330 family)
MELIMTKAYLIVHTTVTNPEGFAEYARQSMPIIQSLGGKYLVRGGGTQLEGTSPGIRHVVIEFESHEAAEAAYYSQEYQNIIRHRQNNTISCAILADGLESPESPSKA